MMSVTPSFTKRFRRNMITMNKQFARIRQVNLGMQFMSKNRLNVSKVIGGLWHVSFQR